MDLSSLNLPTLAEQRATPCAGQKDGLPVVLARKERKQTKEQRAKAFRDDVWTRDKGRSRASGKKLTRGDEKQRGITDWSVLGEVDHAYPRSTTPDRIYDVSNGILLSKEENRLRKVVCSGAPEFKRFDYAGPDDRGLPQTFTWRDKDGKVTKQRVG
jgi:hypothetical protein